MRFQKAADEQVDCTDGIISPLTQRSDQMLQVFFQMLKQKGCRVSYWWLDDCRDELQLYKRSLYKLFWIKMMVFVIEKNMYFYNF